MREQLKYHHCYATANDDKFYYIDLKNLLRLKEVKSGLKSFDLYIAISKVRKVNFYDRLFVWLIKRCFNKHSSINLKNIVFKSNLGRDFSSYNIMLDNLKSNSGVNDFVFFQNRSGFGPLRENWYLDFVKQYNKFKNTALVGSTISFLDFPERSNRLDLPHVQTYAFLSNIYVLNKLENGFPARFSIERKEIICEGEIGLSQFFLKKGYGISCIEWPNEFIKLNTDPISTNDPRGMVLAEHQFLHKVCFNQEKVWKKRRNYLKILFSLLKINF